MKMTAFVRLGAVLAILAGNAAWGHAQSYVDAFTRSDNASLGSPWVESEETAMGCSTSLEIDDDRLRIAQCTGAMAYYDALVINDQYSRLKWAGTSFADQNRDIGGPAVRISGTRTSASLYIAEYDWQQTKIRLYKYVSQSLNGAGTLLIEYAGGLSTGDWLEIRAQGSTITVLRNAAQIMSVADTAVTSGKPGVAIHNTGSSGGFAWDEWEGGSLALLSYGDLFTRANSNSLSSPWVESEETSMGCDTSLTISSNNLYMSQCTGAMAYYDMAFSNDHSSRLKWAGTSFSDQNRDIGGPAVRVSGTRSSAKLYLAEYDWEQGKIRLKKYNNQTLNGAGTDLGTEYSGSLSTGDWLELKVSGSSLTVYKNTTSIITATDSAITTGKAGIAIRNPGSAGGFSWTEWEGGNVEPPPETSTPTPTTTPTPPSPCVSPSTTVTVPATSPAPSRPGVNASYEDPKYCTDVTRLTDSSTTSGTFTQAEYATQVHFAATPISPASEPWIYVNAQDHIRIITSTGSVVEDLDGTGGFPSVGNTSLPRWHQSRGDVLYYISNTSGTAQLRWVDVDATSNQDRCVAQFTGFQALFDDGKSDLSPDRTKMVFYGTSNGTDRKIFVYTLPTSGDPPTSGCGETLSPTNVFTVASTNTVNYVQISNSFVVVGYSIFSGSPHGQAVRLHRITTMADTNGYLAHEVQHNDVGIDKDGNEVFVVTLWRDAACQNGLTKIDLAAAATAFEAGQSINPECLRPQNLGNPVFHGSLAMHISLPPDQDGVDEDWVYVSTYRPNKDCNWKPFGDEVFRVRLTQPSGVSYYPVERFAHHYTDTRRTAPGCNDGTGPEAIGIPYETQPRASVNRDGSKILFNSNWGVGNNDNYHDVYVITVP
jgi:heme-degrading monooxygenase HmoA